MYKDVQAEYTVLVFWEASCGHCKKELPKLAHYIDSVKTTIDIKVYSVSKNHDDEWKKFIRDNNLDFVNVAVPKEVYSDQQKATEYIRNGFTDLKSLNYNTTYDIFTTPQIYLLDKNKKIIGKKLETGLLKTIIKKEEAIKKR
jgi:peroxiredoxin